MTIHRIPYGGTEMPAHPIYVQAAAMSRQIESARQPVEQAMLRATNDGNPAAAQLALELLCILTNAQEKINDALDVYDEDPAAEFLPDRRPSQRTALN